MNCRQFRLDFCSRSGAPINCGAEWLNEWSLWYPEKKYPSLGQLLSRSRRLTSADFRWVGRWKDGALNNDKWRRNVAMVAFPIWMQAADELPGTRIESIHVARFLEDWSSRSYQDQYPNRAVKKKFGLSRATALLHVLSAGNYPIFDSRVRRAFRRLTAESAQNTVTWYLGSYVFFFWQLLAACGSNEFRIVDRALFVYGAKDSRHSDKTTSI